MLLGVGDVPSKFSIATRKATSNAALGLEEDPLEIGKMVPCHVVYDAILRDSDKGLAALETLGALVTDAIDSKDDCPFGLKGLFSHDAHLMKQHITVDLPNKDITSYILHAAKWNRDNVVIVDEDLIGETSLSEEDRKAVHKLLEDLEIVGKIDRSRLNVCIQASYISDNVP